MDRPICAANLLLVYYESKMRRVLSILLILFFSVGPLAAALESNDDARMPACCRRHGAHHCAMSMGTATVTAQDASEKAILTTPATCPSFPGNAAATTTAPEALTAPSVSQPVLLAQLLSRSAGRAAARLCPIRTRASRGPPDASIA